MLRFILLLVLILLLVGLSFYQHNNFIKIKYNIKKEIFEELKRQRDIEERIKEEIEAKKKTQEFLIQLDYEKKLIASLEQEIADLKELVQKRLGELNNYFTSELNLQNKNLKDYHDKISSLEEKLNGLVKNLTSQLDYLRNRLSQLNKKISFLQEEIRLQESAKREQEQKTTEILFRLKQLEERPVYQHPQEIKNDTE